MATASAPVKEEKEDVAFSEFLNEVKLILIIISINLPPLSHLSFSSSLLSSSGQKNWKERFGFDWYSTNWSAVTKRSKIWQLESLRGSLSFDRGGGAMVWADRHVAMETMKSH